MLLEVAQGRVLATSPPQAEGAQPGDWWNELTLMGEPGSTGLALGLDAGGDGLRPWLRVPLDSPDGEGELLLLLSLSLLSHPMDLGMRLRAAYAERESRHSLNQPLTAITFLVENLLFACHGGEADSAYLDRKRTQMLGELQRLQELLRRYEVLTA